MADVVLIEDDPLIRNPLDSALTDRGYVVLPSGTGLEGLRLIVDQHPDIVVLDLGLPDVEGLQLLKMIRSISNVPVIAATGNDTEAGIVRALNSGVDDYVVKPYSSGHLEARIRAVLRRSMPEGERVLIIGALQIDPSARLVTLSGQELELSRKEFDLLAYLASQPGRVVSKRELLAAVWDQPLGGADKTVDVHISWLRRKLGESASDPKYIKVMRGAGVKLVDPAA